MLQESTLKNKQTTMELSLSLFELKCNISLNKRERLNCYVQLFKPSARNSRH